MMMAWPRALYTLPLYLPHLHDVSSIALPLYTWRLRVRLYAASPARRQSCTQTRGNRLNDAGRKFAEKSCRQRNINGGSGLRGAPGKHSCCTPSHLVFWPPWLCIMTVVMAALWNTAGHYIFALWFLLSIFLFFPGLISAVAHWISTILPHTAWP